MTEETPRFIVESELLHGAYRLARAAHHGPARAGDTDIDHPVAVAEVLHEHGFDDPVVAAALLHDVIEDTTLDAQSIEAEFGPDVGRLVSEMTEDQRIESYEERKAEHRSRISRDPRVAAIYAADKLANTRDLAAAEVPPEKLRHYLETLVMLRRQYPGLPFLVQLDRELSALVAERGDI